MTIRYGKKHILPIDENGHAIYQVVEQVPGASAAQLYQRSRKWFANGYDWDGKLQLSGIDSLTGELTSKGWFKFGSTIYIFPVSVTVSHCMSVKVKEDQYQVEITNLSLKTPFYKGPIESVHGPSGFVHDTFIQTDTIVQVILLESFRKAMKIDN
ncbi:DUF4468 domain-containing protein [Fibrella aestuarina]|uniref:DUF4468 domain-containing protein n=1 Tax=Fibrella aestuarina TaxID=651143 RepID=UPI001E5D835E|nr:DUF4468 domain-containing protein [Fibrella aestuarina]